MYYGCSSLEETILLNSLKTIDVQEFYLCSKLKKD